jgi:hypothetical protein
MTRAEMGVGFPIPALTTGNLSREGHVMAGSQSNRSASVSNTPVDMWGYDWSWAFVNYRPVPGFPRYRVGDDGSVWSCMNPMSDRKSEWRRLAAVTRDNRRYLKVILSHQGKQRAFFVHRLVLELFVGPCPPGMQALHRDDDKYNNRLSNLYWGTPADNVRDRIVNGRNPLGVDSSASKLSDADVIEIRRLLSEGTRSVRAIGRLFNVHKNTILGIRDVVTWKHV